MATITFGLGQSYDWSSTYWSTLTNVQGTRMSSPTADDGWKILTGGTANKTTDWDNLTGFTTAGTTHEIDPTGQLHSVETDDNAYTHANDNDWSSVSDTNSILSLCKFDTLAETTSTGAAYGFRLQVQDGAEWVSVIPRSDGTNIDFYGWTSGGLAKQIDSSEVPDALWHVFGWRKDADGKVYVIYDGQELGSEWVAPALGDNPGRLYIEAYKIAGDTSPECHYDWTKAYNSDTPWNTSDGILESDTTSAVFDAGAGRQWAQVDWTHDTSNSTTITYQVRTAATSGGLSSASYEIISNSGDAIVTKGRFIQVKITMADASSGKYTPIAKTLSITDQAVPAWLRLNWGNKG